MGLFGKSEYNRQLEVSANQLAENAKQLKATYRNLGTGDAADVENASIEDVCELIRRLVNANVVLIVDLPTGMSLDFHSDENCCLFVEFYEDDLHGAFVSLEAAEQICRRAIDGPATDVQRHYGDLIGKWEY